MRKNIHKNPPYQWVNINNKLISWSFIFTLQSEDKNNVLRSDSRN